MSAKQTTKEISPLLINNKQNNNVYSSCNDNMASIAIHRPSSSMSKSSKSSRSSRSSILLNEHTTHHKITPTAKTRYFKKNKRIHNNITNNNHNDSSSFKTCLGRFLLKCEPCTKKLKIGYYVILSNAVLVCVLLIISRIFSHPSTTINKHNLFHSDIFMSNSAPLLLTANIIMMMSYSLENFLALRICLGIGCLCFALWGLTNTPILLDTTMFNTVMMLLNLSHAMKLSYRHRHIFFKPCWEQIYMNVFKGYLNRVDFKKLVDISYVRKVKKGEIFKTKGDEVTSLCILVTGRISVVREVEFEPVSRIKSNQTRLRKVKSVSHMKQMNEDFKEYDNGYDSDIEYFLRNPNFVNLCHKNQFIEAPQWVAADLRPDGDRFTVSFVAVDDCEYIKWPRENLIELIEQNGNMKNALAGVLGLHTARALLKSREYNKMQQCMESSRKITITEDNGNSI